MDLATKRFPAQLGSLAQVNAFLEECAGRCHLGEDKTFGLLVAVEEAFVNVCSYAYPEGDGDAELRCGGGGGVLVLELADEGGPFDVLSLPAPDVTLSLDERPIGGLGVHLIRTLSDGVSYRREAGRNILRMEFRAAGGDAR